MKKISILFLVVTFLTAISFQLSATSNVNSKDNSKITLIKETPSGQPKAPSQNPVSFSAFISDGILTVYAVNYFSTVEIEITGPDLLSQSFDFSNAGVAVMDLKCFIRRRISN